MSKKLSILFTLFSLLSTALFGQLNEAIKVTRITEPVVMDGKVDEAFWQEIETLPLITQSPVFGEIPKLKSEFRIAYDDDYLYYSGKMFVDDPEHITDNSKKRDAFTLTDYFGINLDTYNDNINSLAFFTAPSGLRFDAAVFNDGQGGLPLNLSWNNFWDTAVTRDDQGWYAEIRIPWSSLQFQPVDGRVTMGMTSWRYHAHDNELSVFPEISPAMGEWSTWRPSLGHDLVFENIKPKKPFYVTPYALTGYTQRQELNTEETEYIEDNSLVREVGLDVKYGISNNWTLDLSLNTDFAQVEVDDAQVNLTRFGLFFPEKRLFFQERSGIFNFNFGGGGDQVFYSRRIGIDEDGNPIRLLGGVRLTGRAGPWDVGLINMQTANTSEANGQNFTVARVKRTIINENSQVGFIMTNLTDLEGDYNTVVGLDADVRLFDQSFLSLRWAHSMEDSLSHGFFESAQNKYWLSLVKRSSKGFIYAASISTSGRDFNPDMGFELRDDYGRHGHRFGYNWFPKTGPIFRHGPITRGRVFWSKTTKEVETVSTSSGYEINWRNNWSFSSFFKHRFEMITEEFEISEVINVPFGSYDFNSLEANISSDFSQPIFVNTNIEFGSFYDGNIKRISISPGLNVSSNLEFSATYQLNRISFNERNQSDNIHLAQINALYMFSTKFSIASILQYNSIDKAYLGNIRIRYNPKEGNDLFIVYNDLLNTDRLRSGIPEIPRSTERTILLKYSYTFRL